MFDSSLTCSLQEILSEYKCIVGSIAHALLPLMKPFQDRVEEALSPGMTSLTWTSLNVDACESQSSLSVSLTLALSLIPSLHLEILWQNNRFSQA